MNVITERRLQAVATGVAESTGRVEFAGQHWQWTMQVDADAGREPAAHGRRRCARPIRPDGTALATVTGFYGTPIGGGRRRAARLGRHGRAGHRAATTTGADDGAQRDGQAARRKPPHAADGHATNEPPHGQHGLRSRGACARLHVARAAGRDGHLRVRRHDGADGLHAAAEADRVQRAAARARARSAARGADAGAGPRRRSNRDRFANRSATQRIAGGAGRRFGRIPARVHARRLEQHRGPAAADAATRRLSRSTRTDCGATTGACSTARRRPSRCACSC